MHTYSGWGSFRRVCLFALVGTLIAFAPARADAKFKDPLDYPAKMCAGVTTRPLLDITHAGTAMVAVGSRGMIIRSEDGGKNWTQSAVPVQSDLLAVNFPTSQDGWAVGHSGVILHSSDGGKNWTKQLDGRIAADVFKKYYAARLLSGNVSDPLMTAAAAEIDLNYKVGPSLPWLSVWFEDAERGFVVGSYGQIAATSDGGKTWEPWLHRVDNNEQWLNLNSIRDVGGNIYIAAERGMVFMLDRENQRFRGTETGYAGSFFGIVGDTGNLLAFGLRGVVYRSANSGATWEALKMPTKATMTAGTHISDSVGFILVNNAGQILQGDMMGRSFRLASPGNPMCYTGAVPADQEGAVVVTGLAGVRIEMLSGTIKSSDGQ
ncbi:hypothetical protein DSCO28_26090 [Desulfosarcina ovata subsp. sediminis]|uniref:Photosynthesis system II assembly factor Ycf48/Hcf136-like domain-containing protein n=1 Tax=Desulfosarcina ovata subsp. sediminis TaxID=885957 RepID=A0A5K7ZRL5_9BACT|nr:YCF48-related protein [Desulfosarcina ovata]BBO82043.1 hypothetical protein DSCO28_26090 [Desulfosarcina ovata subsp. sediminis]